MISRRRFLATAGAAPAAALFAPAGAGWHARRDRCARAASGTPEQVAEDEDFWFTVQQAFTVDRSIINLNNGGVSPSPRIVQDAMKRHLDFSNQAPVYTMWRVLEPQREPVRAGLARMFGWTRRRWRSRAARRRGCRSARTASTWAAATRWSPATRTIRG